MEIFNTIKLDLDTQKQLTIQAIDEKIENGTMTDVEEEFWEEVSQSINDLTEDDLTPEKFVRQSQRKLKKIRRAEARIKERLSPKL